MEPGISLGQEEKDLGVTLARRKHKCTSVLRPGFEVLSDRTEYLEAVEQVTTSVKELCLNFFILEMRVTPMSSLPVRVLYLTHVSAPSLHLHFLEKNVNPKPKT